jgi:hypothetical protein
VKQAVVRMTLQGAKPNPQAVGLERLTGKVNYLRGNDPEKWRTNVPTYAKVKYDAVYPGIDLVYYGHERQLEYDFIVAPGADPDTITVEFEGADRVDLDAAGDLVLATVAGPVRFRKPVVYQESEGSRQSIAGDYVRKGPQRIGFHVAAYDAARPLIIDPVVRYATYLGGSDVDFGMDIAVDGTGAAYVTGWTVSPYFPTKSPLQPSLSNTDAFVAKLSPDGTALVYATYLGGHDADGGFDIAIDTGGAAYVAGTTISPDFPVRSAFQPTLAGDADLFVAKLTPDGTALVFSTYLGGEGGEGSEGGFFGDIAVDTAGSAYVTGRTGSLLFPTKSPLQPTLIGYEDAFVVKLAAEGGLVYGTYLGGSEADEGLGIAVDAAGAAFVSGFTNSPDFPTRAPFQPMLNGGVPSGSQGTGDAFVAKLTSDGSSLVYATYLGGSDHDSGDAIAVDTEGAAHIAGSTWSEDFPTESPLQPEPTGAASGGLENSFVAKLSVDGSALAYSTYLGGASAAGIAVDLTGATYVTGSVSPRFDFMVVHPIPPARTPDDTFVTKFSADGNALLYSVVFGSAFFGNGLAVDAAGAAYVTASTTTLNLPTTSGVQPIPGGDVDAFVVKLAASSTDVAVHNVTDLVGLSADEVTTSFDSTPVSQLQPAGTFRIVAGFDNASSLDICNPFFQVVELARDNLLQGVWTESTGQQIQGPQAYPVSHPTIVFASGSRMRFRFDIALPRREAFRFFVNVWGTPQAPGTPCP